MADAVTPVDGPQRVPTVHLVFVAVMCLFWSLTSAGLLQTAYEHDFLSFYTGSSLARDGRFGDLYDIDTQLAYQKEIAGDVTELVPFIRPHFHALLIAPFSLLPYQEAFRLWISLHVALLALCWISVHRRFGPDALIFACLYFPTICGITVG